LEQYYFHPLISILNRQRDL